MNKLTSSSSLSRKRCWSGSGLMEDRAVLLKLSAKEPGFLFYFTQSFVRSDVFPLPVTSAVHTACHPPRRLGHTQADQTPFSRLSPLITYLDITAVSER